MASLHDVARLAGVSKSTVSRVINDEYGVKESTKIKVLKAVEQCGYMVNQVAKDLKSQKTNLIGVIVPRVSSHATAQGVDGLTAILSKQVNMFYWPTLIKSMQRKLNIFRYLIKSGWKVLCFMPLTLISRWFMRFNTRRYLLFWLAKMALCITFPVLCMTITVSASKQDNA